ncbi:OLC1v1001192C1 [Oldenlandia corymbosa var. corymbosa]|uniref:OLC1v1001192C1 n=1 Tax=Oldenlandia corymbosa var. corymbosa TaxID=529605 RepID=A0AAV1D5J8_OLDCO|nr:OLC1v1001192C1 [Oldenlandia corymbosa var. corymbosa]
MNSENLLVSAAINIGLAMFILTLFSILKKQPSNAPIYYARRISLNHNIPFAQGITLRRILPSFDWVRTAFHVSEDDILQQCGLDVLVFIRLLKFGINFFTVSSIVALSILLPLNYTGNETTESSPSHSLYPFTISNVREGSNRLWVHFSCLSFVSCYGLYLLYKEYHDIWLRRTKKLHDLRHRPDQFSILVRQIPFCNEHKAYACCLDAFFSKLYPFSYQSNQILYDCKELEKLLVQAESLKKRINNSSEDSEAHMYGRKSHSLSTLRDNPKVRKLEEMLQDTLHKICYLKSDNMRMKKELPVAFITFRSRLGAALAAQSQQNPNPLLWITSPAPEPGDVLWSNLAIRYRLLPLYEIIVFLAASLLTVFFAIPVTAVQGIAKFEKLRKWFPPAMALQLIPGLRSLVTGYLPSVILSLSMYVVPFCMIGIAQLAGFVSRSEKDIRACNMVFYFLVGNVFFLSLLSGSLLDQIGEYFSHPKEIPNRLATAVSAQADFFMTYILTNGLSGFSVEALQPGLFTWDLIKSHTWQRGKHENAYLYSLPYYRTIPFISVCLLIGMVYAVVSPLLLPFLVGYFLLGYLVFVNQIQDVYITSYETCGQYWPCIHNYIVVAIVLMQITMVGLFGLKSKPSASISTILLLILTIIFNEYCKRRFSPTFHNYPVEEAKKNDEFDEHHGLANEHWPLAANAYCPPCLRPPGFEVENTGVMEPLIYST